MVEFWSDIPKQTLIVNSQITILLIIWIHEIYEQYENKTKMEVKYYLVQCTSKKI